MEQMKFNRLHGPDMFETSLKRWKNVELRSDLRTLVQSDLNLNYPEKQQNCR